jgi:hypothetical protein
MIWIFVPIFCIPVYFSTIIVQARGCDLDGAVFELTSVSDVVLAATVFWMFGVVLKVFMAGGCLMLLYGLRR